MKTLLLLLLLVALSYQISRAKLRSKQDYVEEHRKPGDFKKLKVCKIRRCIKSTEVQAEINRNMKDGGEDSKYFKQFQQKCFYECQMEHCKAKKKNVEECKKDENGLEYKPIFDESDPQFRDYAPTEKELDEYLAIDDDKIVRKFKEKHYTN